MTTTIGHIVGENIERERMARGLSQAELAAQVDVKPLTVYRWESGKSWPTAKNVEALARLFHIDASTFFVRRSPPVDMAVCDALIVISRALGCPFAPQKRRAKA